MKSDDPRLAALDLRGTFHIDPDGPWPKAGEVTAILASSIAPTSPPPAPSIRAIVLNPTRYLDQTVTVIGQYQGRNLTGDLPDAPGREPLRLRHAVRRRGDLDHQHAPEDEGPSSSGSTRASTRGAGCA